MGMGLMWLVQRLRWERSRWLLLLLFAHVLFGARAGLYDDSRRFFRILRFADTSAITTPYGIASMVCLIALLGLGIMFLASDDD